MTAAEYLKLPDYKLAVELAKVLTPGPWKHDFWDRDVHNRLITSNDCAKCGISDRGIPKTCPIPDPIDITSWDVAMKWRDEIDRVALTKVRCDDELDAWLEALTSVYIISPHRGTFLTWLITECLPKHYLIAAALVKGDK